MELVLNENEHNNVSKDIVNDIADGANNTFARGIDHYEQHELFYWWKTHVKRLTIHYKMTFLVF